MSIKPTISATQKQEDDEEEDRSRQDVLHS